MMNLTADAAMVPGEAEARRILALLTLLEAGAADDGAIGMAGPEIPSTPVPASAQRDADRRRELLERFGLISEADLALMWGVAVKTLRNKPLVDLPEHVTMGRQRFFYVKSVEQMMRANVKRPYRLRGRTG
jgi:hypothetical protein